ncbi:MAG: 5-dehydro-2-deoxygluconokinase [Nitratireductor sp.]
MKLLDGIARNNFVVIGRAGVDLVPEPPGTRTEEMVALSANIGGSAANTAIGICKFGGKAALVTSVSDDSLGRFCLRQLDHYGVGRSHVRSVRGEYRTSLAVYESRLEDHQTVLYRNGAADFQMTDADVEAVDYASYGALITAGTVFAAEPSRSAAFRAFELAAAAGVPIIFDVDYRPYSWPSAEVAAEVLSRAAAHCDMIVGNDEEFAFMAGDGGNITGRGLAMARDLGSKKAAIVVYKMGPEGAITFAGDAEIHTGIYKVKALKPTGAGDSFMAGLLSSLAAGFDLETALLRGSACAAITVTRPACAPAMPKPDELEAFISTHPRPACERKTDAHPSV